jgi:hypothetical protein
LCILGRFSLFAENVSQYFLAHAATAALNVVLLAVRRQNGNVGHDLGFFLVLLVEQEITSLYCKGADFGFVFLHSLQHAINNRPLVGRGIRLCD